MRRLRHSYPPHSTKAPAVVEELAAMNLVRNGWRPLQFGGVQLENFDLGLAGFGQIELPVLPAMRLSVLLGEAAT